MKLSKNFSLAELEKSQAAMRLGIPNSTPSPYIPNLVALATNVLQPVRDQYGPIVISSGYRSPRVNSAIGGSRNSQHCFGEAADFEPVSRIPNMLVANWIEDNLEFDQLILEFYTPEDPQSGWVHCSYSRKKNRKKTTTALYIDGKTIYKAGIARYT